MKSVRLDLHLEQRLEEAARLAGISVSQFIREAIVARCDAVLGDRLDHAIGNLIGSVEGTGDASRRTGRDFTESLKRRGARKKKAG